ncbi:MAG: hypothetical protein GX926_03230 [Candidatus Magasanikbacteria bacterium]|jgi:hypothetical protein|nr:hypothetical protein [Candidatus Magasanikbacteria bacterium]
MDIYFSDHFKVKEKELEKYGAFNISLVADLPLFIDPFLLFNSKKKKYQELHDNIIKYLIFLKKKSTFQTIDTGALKAWYVFKEVEQNWLGFSVTGNKGRALGPDFGRALNANLHKIFHEFGQEKVSKGSHLEKLCLIKDGVGKDNISDFATNLIKEFLLEYTQNFAKKYIDEKLRDKFRVQRVRFNYKTESWEDVVFDLPKFWDDFVILTPKELLTKDETWINKKDLFENFERIPNAISDDELRFKVNNYFLSRIPRDPKKKKEPTKQEKISAAFATIQEFPQLIDYYIKSKEENGDLAESISSEKVIFSQNFYINNVQQFIAGLQKTDFYASAKNSYEEAKKKIEILKEYIENNEGYKLFYHNGQRIKGEKDLQLLFGLVCHESTAFDVNREVNNGRGPVDFKVSKGSVDKTLVEFKLANNKKLEQNLQKQVEIYEKANKTTSSFKVIIYFTEDEYKKVVAILNKIGLTGKENIVLIDGRNDNKISASNA